MLPSLHGPLDETIKPSDLNLHLTHIWWKDAPLLADDFQRACIGTDLNWQALTVYWQVRNNFGRNRIINTFGFEWGGSPEDEAINATIHVQQLTSLKQLPGDETFWGTFQMVWDRWQKWVDWSAENRKGKELPKPPPPPAPKPSKPTPPPAPKPTPTPPETPKPAPSGGITFKKVIGWVSLVVTGVGIASFFVPALAPIHAALKTLLVMLQSITF